MATAILDRVWLHDAADLSLYLRLYTERRAYEEAGGGDVRSFGAVRRIITTDEEQRTIPLTFPDISPAELAQLREWKTSELMYRDPEGELLGGAFFTLSVEGYKDGTFKVTTTFIESSFSVEV